MNFAEAQALLAAGKVVARTGWNGSGQFVWFVPPGEYPARMEAIDGFFPGNIVPYAGYYALRNAQGKVTPWVPSMGDLQAADWQNVILPRNVIIGSNPTLVITDELAEPEEKVSFTDTPKGLREYRCHKLVKAARIDYVSDKKEPHWLGLDGVAGATYVTKVYMEKHNPQVGGYFVEYADGHRSYSPAEAFEEGYTLADQEPVNHFSLAQRKQHEVDLLTQLQGALSQADNKEIKSRLLTLVERQFEVVNKLL